MITKTDYLAYAHCPHHFWLAKFRPDTAVPPDPSAQRRMRMGSEVDRRARDLFPDGRLIPWRPDPRDMVPLTAQAMAAGAPVLFQATFLAGDLLFKADILQRDGQGWRLIEVKSGASVKEEYLIDVAFQVYVLRQAGIEVRSAGVMRLNTQCRYPDLDNLFNLQDVTAEVDDFEANIVEDIVDMRRLLALDHEPRPQLGRFCKGCAFHEHCWRDIDGLTIYDIPRLHRAREEELEADGVLLLDHIPAEFHLTDNQRAYVLFHRERQINIDAAAIRSALDQLSYPLSFFDFETIDHAVPIYDGVAPYQQVPFQYSCHVLYADDRLHHREYLHMAAGDPRPALISALLRDIEADGHVVAYNVPFERGVLLKLAGAFPDHAAALREIAGRLWDQLPIFRKHYRDHRFGGSNSLKNVLPVVVPDLSYDALAVQDGGQAQVAWEQLIAAPDADTRDELAAGLRAYCRLDTLAMVEIHRALQML